MLSLLILVPLAGLVLLNLPFFPNERRHALAAVFFMAVIQVNMTLLNSPWIWNDPEGMDAFFSFTLNLDMFGRIILLSTGIVVAAAALTGFSFFEDEKRQFDFASLLLLSLAGMNGMVVVSDLFSLYVFLEVVTVSSFILIAINRDKNALEGSFKYLMLSVAATTMILASVALFFMVAGDTSFDAVRNAVAGSRDVGITKIALGLFICGMFIKGGLVPFHGWLPAAYSSAPAPVSVLLAGITTKVSGIYALARLSMDIVQGDPGICVIFLTAGTASMVIGAVAAIMQTDMKNLLAYSSISQIGYIVLGLGCGTTLGIAGAVFHFFNHSIFKSLLFVNSAAVEKHAGATDMGKTGGLGSKMPVTNVTSLIGILSTAGIPPLSGFWSKLLIILALWQAQHHWLAVTATAFSAVTLAYLLGMERKVFFGKTPPAMEKVKEEDAFLVMPGVILAAILVIVGVFLPFMMRDFFMTLKDIGNFLFG